MANYNYTEEKEKFLLKKMEKGLTAHFIHKLWPEKWKIGDTPSASSITRRMERIRQYGINGGSGTGRITGNRDWGDVEKQDLMLGYRLCEGSVKEANELIDFYQSSIGQIQSNLYQLDQGFQNVSRAKSLTQ